MFPGWWRRPPTLLGLLRSWVTIFVCCEPATWRWTCSGTATATAARPYKSVQFSENVAVLEYEFPPPASPIEEEQVVEDDTSSEDSDDSSDESSGSSDDGSSRSAQKMREQFSCEVGRVRVSLGGRARTANGFREDESESSTTKNEERRGQENDLTASTSAAADINRLHRLESDLAAMSITLEAGKMRKLAGPLVPAPLRLQLDDGPGPARESIAKADGGSVVVNEEPEPEKTSHALQLPVSSSPWPGTSSSSSFPQQSPSASTAGTSWKDEQQLPSFTGFRRQEQVEQPLLAAATSSKSKNTKSKTEESASSEQQSDVVESFLANRVAELNLGHVVEGTPGATPKAASGGARQGRKGGKAKASRRKRGSKQQERETHSACSTRREASSSFLEGHPGEDQDDGTKMPPPAAPPLCSSLPSPILSAKKLQIPVQLRAAATPCAPTSKSPSASPSAATLPGFSVPSSAPAPTSTSRTEALLERALRQTATGLSFARALGRSVGQTAGDVVVCVAQLVATMASIVAWIFQYLSGGPQRTRERFAIATAVASDLVSSHNNYVREYERSTGLSYYTGLRIMNTTAAGVVDSAVIEDRGEGSCSSHEGAGPAAARVVDEGLNVNDHDSVRRLEDAQARALASAAMGAAQQHSANAARDHSRQGGGTFVEQDDEGQADSDSGACAGPDGNAVRRPPEESNSNSNPPSSAIRTTTTSKSKALRKRQKRFEKRFEKEVEEFARAVEEAHAEVNCKIKAWGGGFVFYLLGITAVCQWYQGNLSYLSKAPWTHDPQAAAAWKRVMKQLPSTIFGEDQEARLTHYITGDLPPPAGPDLARESAAPASVRGTTSEEQSSASCDMAAKSSCERAEQLLVSEVVEAIKSADAEARTKDGAMRELAQLFPDWKQLMKDGLVADHDPLPQPAGVPQRPPFDVVPDVLHDSVNVDEAEASRTTSSPRAAPSAAAEPAGPGGAVGPPPTSPFEEMLKDARQYPDPWLCTTNDVTTAMRYMWLRNWFMGGVIPAWQTFLSRIWTAECAHTCVRLLFEESGNSSWREFLAETQEPRTPPTSSERQVPNWQQVAEVLDKWSDETGKRRITDGPRFSRAVRWGCEACFGGAAQRAEMHAAISGRSGRGDGDQIETPQFFTQEELQECTVTDGVLDDPSTSEERLNRSSSFASGSLSAAALAEMIEHRVRSPPQLRPFADLPWSSSSPDDWLSIYKQLISRLDGEAMVLMQAYVDYVAQELNWIERPEALVGAETAAPPPAPSRNDTSGDDPDVYAPVRAKGSCFGNVLPHWMKMGLFWLFEFSQNQLFQLYISFLCMSWGWKVWQAGWNEVRNMTDRRPQAAEVLRQEQEQAETVWKALGKIMQQRAAGTADLRAAATAPAGTLSTSSAASAPARASSPPVPGRPDVGGGGRGSRTSGRSSVPAAPAVTRGPGGPLRLVEASRSRSKSNGF